MIDPVTQNARKPREDQYGNAMLERMNEHHKNLHDWALSHVTLSDKTAILDVGFGGGQNIRNMMQLAENARFYGIDYSPASYKKCQQVNQDAISQGKLEITVGSADALPYENSSFDLITAFETIYYWPNILQCFTGIHRVLKDKGAFLICNEDSRLQGNEAIAEALSMEFYDQKALESLLHQAGFSEVHTDLHENGQWVCAVAVK